jgi:choline monooxygenase
VADFDAATPIEEADTPPSAWYVDSAIADLERTTVFSNAWLFVGRADQVAQSGAYFSGFLAGEPYVVVRGDDGQLRAFFNVCRHHAAEVADGAGCAHEFQCPYHGWIYRNDGTLKKAPKLGAAKNFHPRDHGLVELPVTQWGPLVAIRLAPKGLQDGAQLSFPELHEQFEQSGWNELLFVERRAWDINCNWKVFVDNYLDGGYHVDVLHGDLASRLDLSEYRTEVYQQSVMQTCSGKRDTRVGSNALYGWVYPNFMLNRYGPWLDTNTVVPLDATHCRVVFDYFCEPSVVHDSAFVAESMRASEKVQQEDITICESVQRGLSSKAYEQGRYAPQLEVGEYLFHSLLQADLTR